jgi:hypothetical protein
MPSRLRPRPAGIRSTTSNPSSCGANHRNSPGKTEREYRSESAGHLTGRIGGPGRSSVDKSSSGVDELSESGGRLRNLAGKLWWDCGNGVSSFGGAAAAGWRGKSRERRGGMACVSGEMIDGDWGPVAWWPVEIGPLEIVCHTPAATRQLAPCKEKMEWIHGVFSQLYQRFSMQVTGGSSMSKCTS